MSSASHVEGGAVQVITSLEQLDGKLAECDEALKTSDAAMRAVFATFRMDFSTLVPPDPFSAAYREFQMALYTRISGRGYAPQNERTKFDTVTADRRPFPYYTGSCRTAGFFTMGVGFLLFSLDLPAGARVLEFGPGWGNSTLAMALVGLDVTAVDIEPDFCELLRLRAKRHEVSLTVVNDDFMWAETVREPYDAVVFFECFHHCADHQRLLAALDRAVKPGGRVYFGAEPIVPDFPVPWGVRMDGESLWAIRSNGWLELGFKESYFREALTRAGWSVRKHVLPDIGWAAVWEAQRLSEVPPAELPLPAQTAAEIPCPPELKGPPAAAPMPEAEAALRAQLDAIQRSTSWRITAPLRAFRRRLG
jgi:2-polyprenyl-3-methyl-5-hydroxy-6-metoxy-1,4-benzoquinol methylase